MTRTSKTAQFVADHFSNTDAIEKDTLIVRDRNGDDDAFAIHANAVDKMAGKVVRLNGRAAKLGVEPLTCTVHGHCDIERSGGVATWFANMGNPIVDRYYLVSVSGLDNVKLPGGWEFIGTIQHEEHGNILRTVPSFEGNLPAALRSAPSTHCDHCNTTRRRNDTYVLRNEAGEFVQVGSTCIKDFLGHSAQFAIRLIEGVGGDDDEWGFGYGGRSEPTRFGISAFVALTAAVIRAFGWVPRSRGGEATADRVWFLLNPCPPVTRWSRSAHDSWKADWSAVKAVQTQAREDEAAAAIEWARSINENTTSDYLSNLRIACLSESVTGRNAGIVASVVSAYNREQERETRRAAERKTSTVVNEWAGKVGDKFGRKLSKKDRDKGASAHDAINGKVVFLRTFENEWGSTTLVKVQSDAGNVFAWFKSGYLADVEKGDAVTMIGTVKKLDEYQGQKQTVLTRCVLTAA